MIDYHIHSLSNGLRVVLHQDTDTPMAAVSVLYDVGSRNEQPTKTGLAHLFEHLMFSGSAGAPDYDDVVQRAGGESNAFTSQDSTNYYLTIPAQNLEVALWLEADRMHALKVSASDFRTQQRVVLEEFDETCINEPFGDMWHHMCNMVYKKHPYRWPVIGLMPLHIASLQLEDVKSFYKQFYCPANAVLSVTSPYEAAYVLPLIEKWFSGIESGQPAVHPHVVEHKQTRQRRKLLDSPVPANALYLGFKTAARNHSNFYTHDLISDILADGTSSMLQEILVRRQQVLTQVDAYLSGSNDPGVLLIEARPAPDVSIEVAERSIYDVLQTLTAQPLHQRVLDKHQHRIESNLAFSESSLLNKTLNLGFFTSIGQPDLINNEPDQYRLITPDRLQKTARQLFAKNNSSVLVYKFAAS
jgi:predicted Zn-dependent peptidase